MEITEAQRRLLELCAMEHDGSCADWGLLARQALADHGLDDLCQAIIWERSAAAKRSMPLLHIGLGDPAGPASKVDAELAAASAIGAGLVTVLDAGYPARLRQLPDPPPFLFYLGAPPPPDSRLIAVAGTREPSADGCRETSRLAGGLARRGYQVVSGLAAGIDTAAHEAALAARTPTVAVLGTGITRCYPAANFQLSRRIAATGGALLSRFWPTQPPSRHTFPRRNIVASGVSQATLVIEAGPKSGARMQARIALDQGRMVFLTEPLAAAEDWAAACVRQRGAIAVRGPGQIVAYLTGHPSVPVAAPPPGGQPGPRAARGHRPPHQMALSFEWPPMALADLVEGVPPGFPACGGCPYLRAGPAMVCASCARQALEPVAAGACPVCRQMRGDNGRCRNRICRDPGRGVERIDAVAYLSGPLRSRIYQYKYHGTAYWSLVFGRLLLGWLEANAGAWPELIVANPTYQPPDAPGPGHIEAILRSAANDDGSRRWPFDTATPAAVIKTKPTMKSSGQDTDLKHLAAADLRPALRVPDNRRTEGRRILIVDDVCTTGSQLDTVAACLLSDGGAASVRGLVLARTPWRPA